MDFIVLDSFSLVKSTVCVCARVICVLQFPKEKQLNVPPLLLLLSFSVIVAGSFHYTHFVMNMVQFIARTKKHSNIKCTPYQQQLHVNANETRIHLLPQDDNGNIEIGKEGEGERETSKNDTMAMHFT